MSGHENDFTDTCERCKGLSRQDLCNIYGHHAVLAGMVEMAIYGPQRPAVFPLDTPEQRLKIIKQYYDLLQAALKEEEMDRDG